MAVNPTAEQHRGWLQWELSKLPVLKEKSASAGTFWTTTGATLSEIPWRREQLPLRTAVPRGASIWVELGYMWNYQDRSGADLSAHVVIFNFTFRTGNRN